MQQHHGLMFTDGMDQEAPISKCDGNSDRVSKKDYKGKKQIMHFQIVLLLISLHL